jgi:hypothetical protein
MIVFKRLSMLIAAASIATVVFAQSLGDIIKVGGIALAVRHFGPEMNRAINKLQGFSDSQETMTKVVPILSVGSGGHIGAAQVMGPPDLVRRVQAVAQLETTFLGAARLKALVPIDSDRNLKSLRRVVGVGVSAIIDLRI